MRRRLYIALTTCLTALIATPALADNGLEFGKVIAGYVERVTLQPWDIEVKAKLDTGANTSSIHAEDVERFEKDDDEWVRFTLVLEDYEDEVHRIETEAPVARNILIKDHDDPSSRRAVVELDMCFDGRIRQLQFSLADRSGFIYPVLLGRRFLNDVAVIDPDRTFLTQSACAADD